MRRYVVTQLPDQSRWVILDRYVGGYCALPDGNGNWLPLEWHGRMAAEAWLYGCRLAWSVWEKFGQPVPKDWREPANMRSPWDAAFYGTHHNR